MADFRINLLLVWGLISWMPGLGYDSYDNDLPTIVFLLNEDPLNYGATKTIPEFAKELERAVDCKTTILIARGTNNQSSFDNTKAIREADVLVVCCRRMALPDSQMNIIKNHYMAGKPIIGIRSANHAFSVRETISEGFMDWWEFVPGVLGCENRGHGPNSEPVKIVAPQDETNHPWLRNLSFEGWTSEGYLYRSYPLLDPSARVVIEGYCDGQREPMAWSRISSYGGKVFYSALGEEDDFNFFQFRKLLIRAFKWSLQDTRMK